jgi:4-alpha-glucanotransferase
MTVLIERTWTDAWKRPRTVAPAARRAVLAAMRLEPGVEQRAAGAVLLGRAGAAIRPAAELVLEDGTSLGRVTSLPRDLPHGYHQLRRGALGDQLLLAAPPRCPLPADPRAWGWAVQLYATRSEASWGIGDLADARRLGTWSGSLGASALLVSPLWAVNPGPLPEPSPYYPSTRRFRNPIYLSLPEVPGYAEHAAELAPVAAAAADLNRVPAIDRARVVAAKLTALERIWATWVRSGRDDPELRRYRAARGEPLEQWGVFAALCEEHGPGWRLWPAELHDPGGAAVNRAARRLADRVSFHVWLQWLLGLQLGAAAGAAPLIGDLPVGFDPGGFDAWAWQSLLADASIGAPPDPFNPAGQRWDVPAFSPQRLRAAGYRPFIETIRSALAGHRGLRIDHVLGIFRQWWVPDGASPADGAYVRQPTDELLAILAIESHRAGAIIIGEDLGTVAPGVRRRLASANVLSTRLGLFERRPARFWPRRSVASVTTHDLPTIAGLWTHDDLADQARSGVKPNRRAHAVLQRRLRELAGVADTASLPEVVLRAYAALGGAPSVLALASLEDATLERRRPNLPGTDRRQRDNWSRALPKTLDALERDPFARRLARTIGRARRSGP